MVVRVLEALHVGERLAKRNTVAIVKFLRVKKALAEAGRRVGKLSGTGLLCGHGVVSRSNLRRESLGLDAGTRKLYGRLLVLANFEELIMTLRSDDWFRGHLEEELFGNLVAHR